MSELSDAGEVKPPWFADKSVLVLTYRINRRPTDQGNLFAAQPESFFDHVAECLEFGFETTTSRGRERHWRLGNRVIDAQSRWISGWVGFHAEDVEPRDEYDEATSSWLTEIVNTEQRSTAPFVIAKATRFLCVAKHPDFTEGGIPSVFEALLNLGESRREQATTIWSVEPVLDKVDFEHWLGEMSVVESVTFIVKRPNPDAAESFKQIDDHMRDTGTGTLIHKLTPSDPERGLTKDFEKDSISQGLMEMARKSFARIRAGGKALIGGESTYDQNERVRREHVSLPATRDEATQALIEYTMVQTLEDEEDE